MSTADTADREARRLVNALPAHVRAALAADPRTGVEEHLGLKVSITDTASSTAGSHCSVDGIYFAPSRSIVVQHASAGRISFSILHEAGHSLIDNDDALVDFLNEVPDDRRERAVEAIANEIAARLLIPDALIDEHIPSERGPSAADVKRLIEASGASAEACAVAASRRLPGPGYVLVVETGGIVRFAANHAGALPLARNTQQPSGHLLSDATEGPCRGSDVELRFPRGGTTDPMHADSVPLGHRRAVSVFVRGPASWVQGTTVLARPEFDYDEIECARCQRTSRVYEAACRGCGDRRCGHEDCRWCECKATARRDGVCRECTFTMSADLITDSVCRDCA